MADDKPPANPCASGHMWIPGAPKVHPDGSQSPTLICARCPAKQG